MLYQEKWETEADSGTNYNCAPPTQSAWATAHCDPISDTYSYRTYLYFTASYNQTVSEEATSDTLNINCF
ncbi:hypothetical protein ACFYNO_32885 [Kitasatospora sp. NPDC006697]|uniref:hypothetical protein n=1 Tax=Kitasatospora sp. NPDC006697 TaxID=3364020 RepID=UPI0036CD61B4